MTNNSYYFVIGGSNDGVCEKGEEEECFFSFSFEIISFLCFYGDS